MKYHAIYFGLASALILTPSLAIAQSTPDDKDIEKLTVSGDRMSGYLYKKADDVSRLDLDIKDLPQSISVIGEEMIDDFALNNVNTVLDTVTGLNVEEVETDRTYYTARGFDITNFQVDGLGLPVLSGNVHGDVDTAIYQKVEVLRGANGMMTGTGSPSATINYVRKKPTENTQISARAQLGSWSAKRLDVDASVPLSDKVGARVVVAKETKDSYLDRYELDKTVAYGVISAALTDTTVLTVGASQQTSDAKGNMWGALTLYYADGTPTNFDTSTNTAADWSNWDVTDTRYFAFLEQELGAGWSLKADYTRIETDEDSELFYTYVSRDPDTGTTLLDPTTGLGLIGYGSEYDLDDQHDYADIYVNGSFDAFGQSHDLMFGASYAKVAYTDTSLYDFHTGNGFPLLPAMENWTGDTPFPEFTDGETGSDVEEKQTAAYFGGNFALTNKLSLLAGGRFNNVEVNGISYDIDETLDENAFVPYAGLVYAITDSINSYVSYTEVFTPQTERNADFERIDPITGESKEIGIKASLMDDKALLTVAYFDIDQVNVAVANGFAQNPVSGVEEQVYRGADGLNSKGWELDLAGELLPGLQTNLGLTVFDITGDQLVSDYTPEKLVNINATYQFQSMPKFKVGTSIRWQEATSRNVGPVPAAYANAGEDIVIEQDAYALVNLMASYAVNDSITITANVNNATDEKYLKSLYWEQGYYGAPRNYLLSLTWAY
ncbi:TonB-dependent siderophore receptor [Alteromonas gilva]|uniref:TonB-dependent siderophore receptor n=1 Tax=Alteromonas gilva TaxID=2987522 RepID=A0ABT5KZP4_9ALTE|nr:TonB-dependent siderophore receptor [Alteromonas gilva]MDC8829659.1 TonB-dependent siderophore receptor [Alteromonas gilva]